jgi:hypothetical protein
MRWENGSKLWSLSILTSVHLYYIHNYILGKLYQDQLFLKKTDANHSVPRVVRSDL